MKHDELLEEIRLAARKAGLIAIHHADSRRDAAWDSGFPDTFIASPYGHGLLAVEAKTGGDQLSHNQQVWRRALQANGCSFVVCHDTSVARELVHRKIFDLSHG